LFPYILNAAAKVRISEHNTKEKRVFLFIVEREDLKTKFKGSANQSKYNIKQQRENHRSPVVASKPF